MQWQEFGRTIHSGNRWTLDSLVTEFGRTINSGNRSTGKLINLGNAIAPPNLVVWHLMISVHMQHKWTVRPQLQRNKGDANKQVLCRNIRADNLSCYCWGKDYRHGLVQIEKLKLR